MKIQCCSCGIPITSSIVCGACEEEVCGDCVEMCVVCETSNCKLCTGKCSSCSEVVCMDCIVEYDNPQQEDPELYCEECYSEITESL